MKVIDKLNPQLADLPVYQPGRPIEEVARELGLDVSGIIKVASNENPIGPSPAAIEAMQKAARGMHLYPDGNCFHLKRRLAEKLGMEPSNLIMGNGSNEIIEFVGHAFLRPGTNIVVSEYCFAIYPIVARMLGARVKVAQAKEYGHDLEAMLELVDEETQILFVANPNNPTGTLAPRDEILALVDRIPEHVLLVLDEAYYEFLEDAADLLPRIREAHPNLLIMRTFSKIYGLAGLRVGYGIGNRQLVAALEKIRQPFNINAMAQAGALAALDDDAHLDATRATNREGLAFLEETFRGMGLELVPSFANFSLVRTGNGAAVCQALQKAGVITRPMGGYGLPDWIRVSVGTMDENRKCIEALKPALEKG